MEIQKDEFLQATPENGAVKSHTRIKTSRPSEAKRRVLTLPSDQPVTMVPPLAVMSTALNTPHNTTGMNIYASPVGSLWAYSISPGFVSYSLALEVGDLDAKELLPQFGIPHLLQRAQKSEL